jgi:membrane protease YdiL (CAAX protease family)
MKFPVERFLQEYSFLDNVPSWAAWLVVIMISAVAAICEEIGFRGYMQVPLEKKYGPLKAISIVSIIFVLVHLHQDGRVRLFFKFS